LISWGLIAGVQSFLGRLLAQQPEFIRFLTDGMELTARETLVLPLILLGLGGSVGLMGSLFAVRRFSLR
jgi:cell division transport system permease protein